MILNREIHRLLRYLQIKYRRVRKASEFNLAIIEVHVLVELDAGKELSVNQLTEALITPQSQVTRVLQKLRERRLIAQRQDKKDSRRVLSTLTREGKAMITRIDSVMGDIFSTSARSLNTREQRDLARFFEIVARGYGCTIIRARPGETRLRASHRQMARIFGLLGTNVYGSNMTRSQWSILETINRAPEAISANILESYLGIRTPLISEILNSFEAHGYIEKTRSSENHRVNLLHATAAGRKLFRRLETQAVIRLRRCLQRLPTKEVLRLHEILKRFAGEWGRDSIFLAQSLSTRLIESPLELRNARAFSLREIVSRGWEYDVPDPLFSSSQQIWGLFDQTSGENALRAVCAVAADKTRWAVNFGVWNDAITRTQFNAFIQHAHYLSLRRKGSVPVTFSYPRLDG